MTTIKKCKDGQILNPETNRCVDENGSTAKKLLQKYLKNEIQLPSNVVAKISKGTIAQKETTEPRNDIVAKTSKGTTEPNVVHNVPPFIKARLAKYLQNIRDKNDIYVDDSHKDTCLGKQGKGPIIHTNISVTIPFYRLDISDYKEKKIPLNKVLDGNLNGSEIVPGDLNIEYDFSNYDSKLKFSHMTSLLPEYKSNPHQFFYDNFDREWFIAQNEYIKSLSKKQIFTLLGYTFVGDEVVNSLMRGTFNIDTFRPILEVMSVDVYIFPFFFQAIELISQLSEDKLHKMFLLDVNTNIKIGKDTKTILSWYDEMNKNTLFSGKYKIFSHIAAFFSINTFWIPVLHMFIKDLSSIIKNAPPLRKKLVVFRGVTNDYYLKGKTGFTYKNIGFHSASMSVDVATGFMGKSKCCLKKITVLPGTRALIMMGISMFPHEMEVLFNFDSLYMLRSTNFIKQFKDINWENDAMLNDHVCNQKPKKTGTKITNIILLK